jgi:3'-phosphoadenosine 5'-phosphosulfate sulfotransferase (PAPS reductase)/FAD synthetase
MVRARPAAAVARTKRRALARRRPVPAAERPAQHDDMDAYETDLSSLFPVEDRIGPLTVLSNGSGQDSSAMIVRLALDQDLRARYVRTDGHLLIVGSDTGDEHPETYEQERHLAAFCARHGIEYVFLRATDGFHSDAWRSLTAQYRRNATVGSKKGFRRTCTVNLKIAPFYRFLEHYVSRRFEIPTCGEKSALKGYARLHGKIPVLIGFTQGEERRLPKPDDVTPSWMQTAILRRFPLMEWGWTRGDCQDYLRSVQERVPPPSQCRRCHFKTHEDIALMERVDPDGLAEWIELEDNKRRKFAGRRGANHGVFGEQGLREVLAAAKIAFDQVSTDELIARRNARGHAICNRL